MLSNKHWMNAGRENYATFWGSCKISRLLRHQYPASSVVFCHYHSQTIQNCLWWSCFSTYRQSTKNSALLLPWSTISWWSGLDLHTLNSTFPKLGTSFAHAWYRIFGNVFFYCGFVLLDPEIEVACHLLKLGLCLADSCWARVLVALPSSQRLSCLRTPYMPAPRIKKYLRPSVGLASVRVAAALLARDFQWRILFCLWSCYNLVQQIRKTEKAEIGIRRMFGPRSSSDSRTDSWRIQFVSDPLTRCPPLSSRGYILPCLHLLGIQSCCIAPRPRVQLMTTTLRS